MLYLFRSTWIRMQRMYARQLSLWIYLQSRLYRLYRLLGGSRNQTLQTMSSALCYLQRICYKLWKLYLWILYKRKHLRVIMQRRTMARWLKRLPVLYITLRNLHRFWYKLCYLYRWQILPFEFMRLSLSTYLLPEYTHPIMSPVSRPLRRLSRFNHLYYLHSTGLPRSFFNWCLPMCLWYLRPIWWLLRSLPDLEILWKWCYRNLW